MRPCFCMDSFAFTFPSGTTQYCFEASMQDLYDIAPPANTIIISDETVAALHKEKVQAYRMLTFPAGEEHKNWNTIAFLANQLLELGAHRETLLLGLGGGVVTDITGFLASIYMRGIKFAYVPTTLLGMVDASIGGKNGINTGKHKNLLGTIKQPKFILYHTAFLSTLPDEQWSNGFAEIIKYGYIADTRIITNLQQANINWFQKHPQQLSALIAGVADIKNKIVNADEQESGIRQVLNFGHTAGHAFELMHQLPHGHAIGLGMLVAMRLSGHFKSLPPSAMEQLTHLLAQYGLPTIHDYDKQEALEIMRGDKKGKEGIINYILLEKPGIAVVHKLSLEEIRPFL